MMESLVMEISDFGTIRQRKMSGKVYDFINIPANISKSLDFTPNEKVMLVVVEGDLVIKRIQKKSIIPEKEPVEVPVEVKITPKTNKTTSTTTATPEPKPVVTEKEKNQYSKFEV